MNDTYYYLSQLRAKDLIQEAQNEREAQAALRANKRGRVHWVRRLIGDGNDRLETGEKN